MKFVFFLVAINVHVQNVSKIQYRPATHTDFIRIYKKILPLELNGEILRTMKMSYPVLEREIVGVEKNRMVRDDDEDADGIS